MSEKDKKELEAMTVNDIERLSYELEIQSEEVSRVMTSRMELVNFNLLRVT